MALSLALWFVTAFAIRPPETLPREISPSIVRTFPAWATHSGEQQRVWQDFIHAEGTGWSAVFSPRSSAPWRMMGPGITMQPIHSEADAAQAAMSFAKRYATLLGVDHADIQVARTGHHIARGMWYADLDVIIEGKRVWRGGLTFRFDGDKLVMVGTQTWPQAEFSGAFNLSSTSAFQQLRKLGPVADRDAWTLQSTEAMWLPQLLQGKPKLRAVWVVKANTNSTLPGQWTGFIDAESGELLGLLNDVRYATGTLTATIDRRDDDELGLVPLRNAKVVGASAKSVSDQNGDWSLDTDGPFTLALDGPRGLINDMRGTTFSPIILDGAQTITGIREDDKSDGDQAALTAFLSVQRVQDVAHGFAPEVPWTTGEIFTKINVNTDDNCNAFFDGELNFFVAGSGCRNTGRLPDVVYHEWGHGFHYYSIQSGDFDGSLSEGAADVMSMIVTHDHALAPRFFVNGGGSLRELQNNQRYPQDYSNGAAADPHYNGLIFGGSLWDLRLGLEASLGQEAGFATMTSIYAGILRGGTDIPGTFHEAILTDDDDADLGNGTPHQCEIIDAFGKHGLGPLGGYGLNTNHTLTPEAPFEAPTPLNFRVDDPAPQCFSAAPTKGTVHWRVVGKPWKTLPLEIGQNNEVSAALPTADLPLGTILEYWVEIKTLQGTSVYEPIQGGIRPHTMYVGDVIKLHCDDFESDNGGYKHKLVSGIVSEGADDWMWGRPKGMGGDPAKAASGKKIWGTDLGGTIGEAQYNGQYQDSKQTSLMSPAIDTRHMTGVFLRYARWLQVEDAVYDLAAIYANDETVWFNHSSGRQGDKSEDHLDDSWEIHSVDLQGIGDDGSVQIAWEITSDQGLGFAGWNIDDVCILAPATADNRLGIDDFQASRASGDVQMTWTAPRFGPVDELVVVRTHGRWPTGPKDGKEIFRATHIDLGAAMSASDTTKKQDMYYAVYASDGVDWLSWTRPSYNAAAVGPAGGEPLVVGEHRKCSCQQGGSPAGLALLLLGLTMIRRKSQHDVA